MCRREGSGHSIRQARVTDTGEGSAKASELCTTSIHFPSFNINMKNIIVTFPSCGNLDPHFKESSLKPFPGEQEDAMAVHKAFRTAQHTSTW